MRYPVFLFILFPLIAWAQPYYRIEPEPYPQNLTYRVTLFDGQDNVVKDWSRLFSRVWGPSEEDSLFVAEIGPRDVFLCLDKQLNVKFLFPHCYDAGEFHRGYSVIRLRQDAMGAVNRNGDIIFKPENEVVFVRDNGTVVAGNVIRHLPYYLFLVKNQDGAAVGSFHFQYPEKVHHLFELPTHMTQWSVLLDETTSDNIQRQEDRLLVMALRNHLRGQYLNAIGEYTQLLQQPCDAETLDVVKYNILACRQAIGFENPYNANMAVAYAEIDGLFGSERQQKQQELENAILFESGLGVLFPDIIPKPSYKPVDRSQRTLFHYNDHTVEYEALSGYIIRSLEDTCYKTLKDRLFFPGCLDNESLVSVILQEKEDFLSGLVPNNRLSKGTILLSFEEPNETRVVFLGGVSASSLNSRPHYLPEIMAFVKRLCEIHQLHRLVLTFPADADMVHDHLNPWGGPVSYSDVFVGRFAERDSIRGSLAIPFTDRCFVLEEEEIIRSRLYYDCYSGEYATYELLLKDLFNYPGKIDLGRIGINQYIKIDDGLDKEADKFFNLFLIHYTEPRSGCNAGEVSLVIKPEYSSLSEQIVRVCFNHGLYIFRDCYSGQWTIRNRAEAFPPQLEVD